MEVQDAQGKVLVKEGPFAVLAGDMKSDLILDDVFFTGNPVFKTREPILKESVAVTSSPSSQHISNPNPCLSGQKGRYSCESIRR